MKKNIIREKAYAFSLRIILMTREMRRRKIEAILINQVLRSGTSISANVEEAVAGISRAEFSMKISIAYKEAKETENWLKQLRDSGSISLTEFDSMYRELEEILKILWSILKKTRMNKEG